MASLFPTVVRFVFLPVFFLSIFPSASEAVPAFARKYDLSCTSCHTKPPRLNAFGEAFHMAGFQIPMTREGEIKKKARIGRIYSETEFLNIFSIRVSGNFLEAFNGGDRGELSLAFPQAVELYLAGTFNDDISYFFELENESIEIEGLEDGGFEEKSNFGIGKEFFLMFDLSDLRTKVFPQQEHQMGRPMIMGPMIMVGKIDPSTNFSYPTNRQFVLNVPGRVGGSGKIERFTLAPYAFASKFYGMQTAGGEALEVTKSVLYNSTGDYGADLHFMAGNIMIQTGVMQGLRSGNRDANTQKDPYLMGRMNFGREAYISGSVSGLVYWGNDTGQVPRAIGLMGSEFIDWLRYGVAANIKIKLLDLYGAIIWDRIKDLPEGLEPDFDDTAYGLTLEADFLASDHILLSLRYDQLQAGGLISDKANGKLLTLQTRYYVRDNFSVILRDSLNLGEVSSNPIQNYRNLFVLGVDFDF